MKTKANSRVALAQERRKQAFTMRTAGANYQKIGDALGISRQGARKTVEAAMDVLNKEVSDSALHYRTLQLERLEVMHSGLWEKAVEGREFAVDRIVKIMDRQAKLLGLDSPVKFAPTDPTGKASYDPITDPERAAQLEAILQSARDRRDREDRVIASERGADTT